MTSDVPAWLADFQERFGKVIRTPLGRETGTLRARPSEYDAILSAEARDGPKVRARERLAVYNRQYWFRLFGVLQSAFPLTTRLLGHFTFNDYAARFLAEHPPCGFDIDDVPNGFDEFFSALLGTKPIRTGRRSSVEPRALLEAARIDAAWRSVFYASEQVPFRPSAGDVEAFLRGRLRPSPTVALVEEHWPLVELRRTLPDIPGEAPVPLPPQHDGSRWWAFVRKPAGTGQLALEPREAELFVLLARHPIGEALGMLEANCSDTERSDLAANARGWLARSVELDFWIGLE